MDYDLNAALVQATCNDANGKGGLSIAFSQVQGSSARWRCSVRAKTANGTFEVGRFTVCPPTTNLRSRIVAIASCPGATHWTVLVELASGSAPGNEQHGKISLSVGPMGGGGPGVSRVGERPKYYSGAAAAAVAIPAGETVVGWSAFSSGAGATVTIGSGSAIPIPSSGGVAGGSGGLIEGPVTFTFAGANLAGYLIEVAESA